MGKMKWEKSSDKMKQVLARAMEGVDSEERQMFGYPVHFIRGNMFSGLFGDSLFIRLPESRRDDLDPLEPMPGRPMKAYSVIPRKIYSNRGSFAKIVSEAAAYARSLPEKKKTRSPKK